MSDNQVQPGERFGRLVALKGYRVRGGTSWSCWCACGALVRFRQSELTYGVRKSCGCRLPQPNTQRP